MKKIYLKPEMELTECFMLRTAICSNPGNPDINADPEDPFANSAPARKVF